MSQGYSLPRPSCRDRDHNDPCVHLVVIIILRYTSVISPYGLRAVRWRESRWHSRSAVITAVGRKRTESNSPTTQNANAGQLLLSNATAAPWLENSIEQQIITNRCMDHEMWEKLIITSRCMDHAMWEKLIITNRCMDHEMWEKLIITNRHMDHEMWEQKM